MVAEGGLLTSSEEASLYTLRCPVGVTWTDTEASPTEMQLAHV